MEDMHSVCFVEFRGCSSQKWFAVDLSRPELGLCKLVVVERRLVGVGRMTAVVVVERMLAVVDRTTVVAVLERRLAVVVERMGPELVGMLAAVERTGAVKLEEMILVPQKSPGLPIETHRSKARDVSDARGAANQQVSRASLEWKM